MIQQKMRRVAVAACVLVIVFNILALLAGPADAQETPCPWPTTWAPAYATETASTHRQTFLMRPVCAPVTPAPAVEPVPEIAAQPSTSNTGIFGLPLWYERMAGIVAVVGAVFLDILRRRALAARNRPRTMGEVIGVYERGRGGDHV